MITLHIEHKVSNYNEWKKVFDSDPINRKKSGVRSYRIFRPVDDPNYVLIDLEFDNLNDSETVLTALNKLWSNVDGKIIFNPQARILNVEETKKY
ncbi:MAG TPA: hypothetical protein VI362_02855 [Ignavibacteriaceae bacterium]|nr:hypothetical protein [Ignavibacteriaceae bacterium]